MANRSDIVAAAREWIGTPFAHQQRTKGVGVDCVGLLVGLDRQFGLTDYPDPKDYPPDPAGWEMVHALRRYLDRVRRLADMRPADVCLYGRARYPQHLALYVGGDEIVHALKESGKVVTGRLLRDELRGIYRWPGLQ